MAGHRDRAVVVGRPVAGLGRSEDGLGVLAELGSEYSTVGLEPERSERRNVIGEENLFDVDLISEQVDNCLLYTSPSPRD